MGLLTALPFRFVFRLRLETELGPLSLKTSQHLEGDLPGGSDKQRIS